LVSEEDLGKNALKYTKMHAEIISKYMLKYGVNINYAPVIDKKVKGQSLVLKSRCFSSNPDKIVKYAQKMADTYIENNICPCIKHLPGHLGSKTDPHLAVPVCDMPKKEIYQEIEYIKAFKNYPMAMTAHILLQNIDNTQPITMSKIGISEIIRNYLEFDGFLISDAIDMHALKGSISEKTKKCLDAGIDAVSYCGGRYEDLYNICQQKIFLTEKAQIRFANIKKVIHNNTNEIDTSEVESIYMQKFQNEPNKQYEYDATEVLNQMLKKGESL
jgi:beta-N-acetylhexosaminidase